MDAKNCMERDCPRGINEGTGPLKNTKAPLTHAACVPFTDPTPLHEKLEIKYSILPVSKFLSRNKVFLLVVRDGAAREKKELPRLGETFDRHIRWRRAIKMRITNPR